MDASKLYHAAAILIRLGENDWTGGRTRAVLTSTEHEGSRLTGDDLCSGSECFFFEVVYISLGFGVKIWMST